MQNNKEAQQDEDLLEQFYWEFDDARAKGRDERMTVKGMLRFYASSVLVKPTISEE